MQAVLRGAIATPRTTIALIVVLVTLVALALPTRASAELSSSGVELRIAAQRLDDGRTEFALQVWDGERWGERVLPRSRFFPTTAGVDDWLNSSVLNLDSGHTVRISAKRLADDRIEFALQQNIGGEWADRLLPRPRFFPANVAAGRWLYSGRLEPVGYVPFQFRAPSVGGVSTFSNWFETADGDGYYSGANAQAEANGHGTEASGGKVIFMIRCDVLPDSAGELGINATAFQRLSGARNSISLTSQLDDDEPVVEEWIVRGDPLNVFGVSLAAPDPQALFERLRTASSIRLQAAGSPDVDVTFDIIDLYKTGIQDNLEQCGNYLPQPWPDRWPPPAPSRAPATLALLDNPDIAEIADSEFDVVVLQGTVSDEDQAILRARLADGIAFFRERYNTPVLHFDLVLRGPEIAENVPCGDAGGGNINYYFWCRDWTVTGMTSARASSETMVHEYFHLLQGHWNPSFAFLSGQQTPSWLVEGSAFYSEAVYWEHRNLATHEEVYEIRAEHSRGVPQTLGYWAENWGIESEVPKYELAVLAVSWLVEHSDNPDSWLEFWRPWNGRDRWDVFEQTFGITLDEFYVEFEAWRSEHYPPR